jgi:glycerophosphoryl diester phosphodiesterase
MKVQQMKKGYIICYITSARCFLWCADVGLSNFIKKQLFLLLLFWGFVQASKAPGADSPTPLYLTSYTFTDKQPQTGYIKVAPAWGSRILSIKISGAGAKALKVDKKNRIVVAVNKLAPGTQWLDAIVQVQTDKENLIDTFRLMRDAFIQNKVIAHRGAWKNTGATENSIGALDQAIALGCAGSEFDVHLSSDSIPFINHDAKIDGRIIAETSATELAKIKLSNGEALPTLEAYLKRGINQNKTKLILEIKASSLGKEHSLLLTQKTVELVTRLKAQAWVDYISFDYDVCREVMRLAPYAKVAYLMGDKTPEELAATGFYGLDYHYNVLQKNSTWIKDAKKSGLTVNVWTVNEKAMMENLLQQGVDFITTNEPEQLLQMVSAKEVAGMSMR